MPSLGICSRHKDVNTSLLCARCGDWICPNCMTESPVGYRCPDCSKFTKIPTYDLSYKVLIKVFLVAIFTGLFIGGILFIFVLSIGASDLPTSISYYLFIALIAMSGFFIGEAVSLASNRKKGRSLKYICSIGILTLLGTLIGANVIGVGAFTSVNMIIALAISCYLAFNRV